MVISLASQLSQLRLENAAIEKDAVKLQEHLMPFSTEILAENETVNIFDYSLRLLKLKDTRLAEFAETGLTAIGQLNEARADSRRLTREFDAAFPGARKAHV
jgi:hypothetical protein